MHEGYIGGGGKPKKMTKKQIKEMVDNMRKSKVISERSKQFHKKEEIEAENVLKNLDKNL